jgi:hypothetical protein
VLPTQQVLRTSQPQIARQHANRQHVAAQKLDNTNLERSCRCRRRGFRAARSLRWATTQQTCAEACQYEHVDLSNYTNFTRIYSLTSKNAMHWFQSKRRHTNFQTPSQHVAATEPQQKRSMTARMTTRVHPKANYVHQKRMCTTFLQHGTRKEQLLLKQVPLTYQRMRSIKRGN